MAFRKRNRNFSRSSSSSSSHSVKRQAEDAFAKLNKTPENPLEPATMETVPASIQEAYQRAGWAEIMPVQAHAIPYLLEGRHMMIQSRTGSGKTGAYLLPLIEKIDTAVKQAQALVLVPTRELAVQVEKEAKNLFGNTLFTQTLYGGVPYVKQLDALRKGAQLIIGTPGRILDHLERGTLNLDGLQALVFDEADRMLSIGFYPDMKAIQEYLPETDFLATLFSATYPYKVLELSKQFLKNPELLSLSQGQVHIAEMQHSSVHCKKMEKDRVLIKLLEVENPNSSIIFCNTKATVAYVAQVLKGFGYNADELSSELSQSKREHVLMRLRNGETRFLVATDVAARGIDIPMLSHVFLYEPPDDRESYIHRAGRTARAGAAGTVISLVDSMERMELQRIAEFYEIELNIYEEPTEEEVSRVVSQRVVALLEQQKRNLNGLQQERIARYMSLAKEIATTEEGEDNTFLFAMLLDEVYQKALNPRAEYENRNRGRGGRERYNPPSKREMAQKPISKDDTLDSLRADFDSEMRAKYGNQRGDRNASWRHKNSGEESSRGNGRGFGRRDGGFGRNNERGEGFGRNNERSERIGFKNSHPSDDDVFQGSNDRQENRSSFNRGENSSRDDFSRGEKRDGGFRRDRDGGERSGFRRDREDRGGFRRDRDGGERSGFARRERGGDRDGDNGGFRRNRDGERSSFGGFGGRDRDNNRGFRRDEERGSDGFNPRKSFLPKRSNQETEGFKVYDDDNFYSPIKSRKRFSENRNGSDFSPRSENGGNAFPRRNDRNDRNDRKDEGQEGNSRPRKQFFGKDEFGESFTDGKKSFRKDKKRFSKKGR